MLEKLFKSKTTHRLLKLLLFSPPKHLRGIARSIGITPIYVKKELECLKGLGLAKSRSVGNLSMWEINRASPIYQDIRSLFLKTDLLGDILRKEFEKSGVKFALIYGSFASGSESEKSDLDLFIVGKIPEKELLGMTLSAERASRREINPVIWTEEEFEKRAAEGHHLLINIAAKPLIMLKGEENEFRKIAGRGPDRGN